MTPRPFTPVGAVTLGAVTIHVQRLRDEVPEVVYTGEGTARRATVTWFARTRAPVTLTIHEVAPSMLTTEEETLAEGVVLRYLITHDCGGSACTATLRGTLHVRDAARQTLGITCVVEGVMEKPELAELGCHRMLATAHVPAP